MTRELTEQEFRAHLNAFAECDIEGGTAAKDRLLFRAGFAAGLDHQQARIDELEAALKQIEAGNPVKPGQRWLSDIEMAQIAREVLKLPERIR